LLIAWAQELERHCDALNLDYDDITAFYEEIAFLPPKYFPGAIGGHCVLPNIELLARLGESPLLDAIRESDREKRARDARQSGSSAVSAAASS
jgi:hypothetical protein